MSAELRPNRNKPDNQTNAPAHNRQDMEFLPAALEILETPVSPVRMAFLWFICVLAVAALTWGWFGKFDIVATAQGKIQPAGRVKIIESLESGKTKAIPVRNGDVVKAGDVPRSWRYRAQGRSDRKAWHSQRVACRDYPAHDAVVRTWRLEGARDLEPLRKSCNSISFIS